MKKFVLFLIILLPFVTGAQNGTYDLQSCIHLALNNSPMLKNAQLDLAIHENERATLRTKLLPQIDGEMDFIHNYNIQRIILENGAIPAFTNPSQPDGEVIAFQLQLRNTLSPSIHLNQLLYDKSLFETLKSDTIQNTLLKQKTEKSKTDIAVAVTKAYYSILISQEQLDFLQNNLERVQTMRANTESRVKSGTARPIDVQRIQVAVNNMQAEIERSQQNVALSKSILAQLMHLSPDTNINLAGQLDESQLVEILPQSDAIQYGKRTEYSMLQTQKRLVESGLTIEKAGYYPRIYGYAVTGYNPSATDFYNLFQASRFYNYTMIGIHMSVPIYHGDEKRYKLNKYALQEQKIENSLTEIKELIDYQTEQARIKYDHSLEAIKIQKENLTLAEENTSAIKIENDKGISGTIDVLNSETDLRLAQTNYYNALFQAIMAKVDYDQAVGNINY